MFDVSALKFDANGLIPAIVIDTDTKEGIEEARKENLAENALQSKEKETNNPTIQVRVIPPERVKDVTQADKSPKHEKPNICNLFPLPLTIISCLAHSILSNSPTSN